VRRREFIWLIGGAAATWPLAAHAQQPEGIKRIGLLMNLAADDPESSARKAALLQALQEVGWKEGRTCGSTRVGPQAFPSFFMHTRES
jgi:hypothetical protein